MKTRGNFPPCESGDAIRLCVPAHLWQPIETAPDNRSVLIFVPNAEHYGPGIYRAIHVNMGTEPRWHTTGRSVGRDLVGEQPTHWMPLPEPPAHSGEPA